MIVKKIIIYISIILFIVFVYRFFFIDEKNLSWTIINFSFNDTCTQEIDSFYSDDKYEYSFPNSCYDSGKLIVFSNGKIYPIKKAIKKGKVDIDDLTNKGIKIYKHEKIK